MPEISSYLRNEPTQISTSESQSIMPAPQITTTLADSTNSVIGHSQSSQPSANSPTEGGRETSTGNKVPGYAEIEQMVNERLASDSEYQELSAKLEKWKNIESDFAVIDAHTGFITGDGTVTLENLRALAADPLADSEAKAAANRLLNDIPVWNAIAKGDNVAGTHDATEFIENLKAKLKETKDAVRAEVKGEVGAPSKSPNASGGTTPNQAEGAGQLFKAPALSTKPGMEGAVENIQNTLNSIGDAMGDLTAKLADPNLSTADRAKLQASYNQLQQLQSMLMEMFKQLQEAIANTVKMYADVAQNSIRNMR
jgi:hypothetical protein